ncbi:MAG: hypothetical protein HZB95_01560 [Nitrosomonadales bacterium]|nr:hypothetical protein [Nitrosomonadales bacterium]
MRPYSDDDAGPALAREIRQHAHDEGAAGRNLCAALVIASSSILPEDGALLALLNAAEDSGSEY